MAYFGVSSSPCAVAAVILLVKGMFSSLLSPVEGIGGAHVIGRSSSKRLLIIAVLQFCTLSVHGSTDSRSLQRDVVRRNAFFLDDFWI